MNATLRDRPIAHGQCLPLLPLSVIAICKIKINVQYAMNVGYILLLRLSGVQENDKGRERQRRQRELVRWQPRGPVQRQSTVRRRKRICTLAAKRAGAVRLGVGDNGSLLNSSKTAVTRHDGNPNKPTGADIRTKLAP